KYLILFLLGLDFSHNKTPRGQDTSIAYCIFPSLRGRLKKGCNNTCIEAVFVAGYYNPKENNHCF
ncbi:MAG: hypothetical protein V3575_02125, partial [Candidatus Absconditabacteria bacterium]